MKNNFLNEVELFATDIIINELPENVLYHDISFTHRLVSAVKELSKNENLNKSETEILILTAFLYGTGFKDAEMFKGKKLFTGCVACTQQVSKQFLDSIY